MIRVLRAPRPALRRALASSLLPSSSLRIEAPGALPLPWGGARVCLALLRQRAGDDAVERAVAPQRALLSLVLRRLEATLTPAERERRELLRAQPLGFMSHSRMTSSPLLEAWIEALAPLVAGKVAALVLPDAGRLDAESVAMLRHLVRRLAPEERPDLILGFDTSEGPDDPLWRRSVELVDIQLALLEALPDTVVESVEAGTGEGNGEGDGEPEEAPGEAPVDPLDDRREEQALAGLRRDPAGSGAVAEAIEAMRAAFGAFGFATSLRLGMEVLARGGLLPAEVAAEVHTVVALSAYNRQLEAGDPRLTAFLEQHLEAALAAEPDVARRSHLHYRLCINAARRAGDLERGLGLATRALAEAERPDLRAGLAAYLTAWARSGQAYVFARQMRLAEALAAGEEAYALVQRAASAPDLAPREILSSRIVFLDNLAEIALRAGDTAGAGAWQAALEEAEEGLDPVMRVAAVRWAAILRAEGRLREGIRRATQGLEDARRHLNPVMEERFAVALGDLWYRAGGAGEARGFFGAALPIRRRLGQPHEIARAELACAAAAMREGELEEAEARLGKALESPLCARAGARAEALAALGTVAALGGDAARWRRRLNEAIAQAASAGERDALLRVARAAGQGSLLLGRREEAQEAFRRAARIAAQGGGAPPRAVDRLGVLVGLWESGAGDRATLEQALALVPAALEDAEAWWQLPVLLRGVAATGGAGALAGEAAGALAEVARAAGERVDCGPLLEALGV